MIRPVDCSCKVRRTEWERNAWSSERVMPWNRAQQESWLTVSRQSMNARVIFRQEDEPRDSSLHQRRELVRLPSTTRHQFDNFWVKATKSPSMFELFSFYAKKLNQTYSQTV